MRQHRFSQADVENMIQDGTITDAATIAGYLLYLFSDRNRTPEPNPTDRPRR